MTEKMSVRMTSSRNLLLKKVKTKNKKDQFLTRHFLENIVNILKGEDGDNEGL